MGEPAVRVSYEEYLARLEASDEKLEFVDGVIYAMSGGTPEHARIAMAFGAELRAALRGRTRSQRVWSPSGPLVRGRREERCYVRSRGIRRAAPA